MAEFLGICFISFASLIGASGAVLFKKSSNRKFFINGYLVFGILLYILSTFFYILGLKMGRLSTLYPFSSTTYLWVCLFSIKFLNERINALKWLGIFAIISGVSLIGIGS